jgi:hypothetical protein
MRKIVILALLVSLVPALALIGTVRGQVPPPPPPPGGTPGTGVTFTPIPLTLRLKLGHGMVAPKTKQKLTITTLPGAAISIVVTFPNGNKKNHSGTANAAGSLSWSYKQPGSRITHSSRTAKVSAQASSADGQTKSSTKRYTIGFANLDVAVSPRTQKRGKTVVIWVHSTPSLSVQVFLRFHNGSSVALPRLQTGGDGWTHTTYAILKNAPKGRVAVKGYARSFSGETSFQIK